MLRESSVKAYVTAVAEVLRQEREKQKLSMTTVAERSGLSQQMISYVERGIRTPTIDTLFRIADALQVELHTLLERVRRPSKGSKP